MSSLDPDIFPASSQEIIDELDRTCLSVVPEDEESNLGSVGVRIDSVDKGKFCLDSQSMQIENNLVLVSIRYVIRQCYGM